MRKIILILIIFISQHVKSQEKGYKLENLISRFNDLELVSYNLTIDDNEVFIATNLGVFTLEEGNISNQVSEITKWARFNLATNSFESTTKLDLEDKSELYLEIRKGNFLYKIVDQKLLIYSKSIFKKYLDDISIRAISPEYIGTYDGIYDSKLKRLTNYPNYSSGKIRKFNNKIFVLYDGLFYDEDNEFHYFNSLLGEIEINEQPIGYGIDIFPLNQDQYLLFTSKGVWKTDFLKVEAIDLSSKSADRSKTIKFIHQYADDQRIIYLMDNKLKLIDVKLNPQVVINFDQEIVDVYMEQNSSDIYFLSNNSIGKIRDSKIETLATNSEDFHNIKSISDYLVLTSDQGLFRLNKKNLKLDQLINEEFNKQSLEIVEDSIWAGSISGLYKIAINDFETYTSGSIKINNSPRYPWILYAIIASSLIIIVVLIYKLQNKSETAELKQTLTKEDILIFIKNNIATITLTSIQKEFNISYRKLASTLGESPGKIIEKERKRILFSKSHKGKSNEEMSELTGYSVDYIKKISNKTKI